MSFILALFASSNDHPNHAENSATPKINSASAKNIKEPSDGISTQDGVASGPELKSSATTQAEAEPSPPTHANPLLSLVDAEPKPFGSGAKPNPLGSEAGLFHLTEEPTNLNRLLLSPTNREAPLGDPAESKGAAADGGEERPACEIGWVCTVGGRATVDFKLIGDKCEELDQVRGQLFALQSNLEDVRYLKIFFSLPKRPNAQVVKMRSSQWKNGSESLKEEEMRLSTAISSASARCDAISAEVSLYQPEIMMWLQSHLRLDRFSSGITHIWLVSKWPDRIDHATLQRCRIRSCSSFWSEPNLPEGIAQLETVQGNKPEREFVSFGCKYRLVHPGTFEDVSFLPSPRGDDLEKRLIAAAFHAAKILFAQ